MVRYWFNKSRIVIVTWLAVALLLAVACGTAAQPETAGQPPAPAESQAQQPAVPVAEATATPVPAAATAKLDRVVMAVAPLGYDTNYSYMTTISGLLDKRPALEWLLGIDRNTGQYIPERPSPGRWLPTARTGRSSYARESSFTMALGSSPPRM